MYLCVWMGGEVRGLVQTLASSDKFEISVCILCVMSSVFSMTMALPLKRENVNTESHPCRLIHSSLFLSYISFPSPPPNIPFCLYISSPSPSCSSPPHWLDHKVSMADDSGLWKEQGDAGAEHLSGRLEPPRLFSGFWKFAQICLHIWHTCSSHTATDQPTIRSRDFRIHSQASTPTLGCSLCQNVSHIKGKTMTLCNILRIGAFDFVITQCMVMYDIVEVRKTP